MLVVDQKDLIVQAFDLASPAGMAAIEPTPRVYRSLSAGTISGRVLAVSPEAEGSDAGSGERWLVQDGPGVSVLDTSGETVGQVVLTGGIPEHPVAAGTAEGFLLVGADRYIYRVRRDGSALGAIPNATAGGELKRPRAIAWRAGDGAIAVYDSDDDEIQILSPDGAFRQRVGRKGTGPGEISKAVSMAFDASGRAAGGRSRRGTAAAVRRARGLPQRRRTGHDQPCDRELGARRRSGHVGAHLRARPDDGHRRTVGTGRDRVPGRRALADVPGERTRRHAGGRHARQWREGAVPHGPFPLPGPAARSARPPADARCRTGRWRGAGLDGGHSRGRVVRGVPEAGRGISRSGCDKPRILGPRAAGSVGRPTG